MAAITESDFRSTIVCDSILTWVEGFLNDRKAQGAAAGTLLFYGRKLKAFLDYCDAHAINQINQLTPTFLRQYMLFLEETGHNPGGRHAAFRCIRAFLYWYEAEVEPDGWSNPVCKIKAPKVPTEPLDPVSMETVARLVRVCEPGTFTGDRDRAILLCLLDTGARAGEFLAMDLDDLNQATGAILIRKGKGSKPRMVYLGRKSRQALRKYLRHRSDKNPAIWVNHPRYGSERLSYESLRVVIRRRANSAEVNRPALHDFRRAFALSMLRNETDLYTLSRLMGHEGIAVLQRYLKQTYQDTEAAHRRAGPVDNSELY